MKIAITSVPTLDCHVYANELAASHRCSVFENPARGLCRELDFQTLYDIPVPDQLDVRLRLMTMHAQQLASGNGVHMISVIDMLADWARWLWSDTTSEKWEAVLHTGRQIAMHYDEVHWLRQGPARSYNGYDWLDARNAAQIGALIPFIAEQLDIGSKLRVV